MTDALDQLFAVAAGGGDPATREALAEEGTAARQLAEEVGRLSTRGIDPPRVPGLEDAARGGEDAGHRERPAAAAPAAPGRFGYRRTLLVAACILLVVSGPTMLAASLRAERAAHARSREALLLTEARLEEVGRARLVEPLDSGWLDLLRWRTGRRMTTAVDGYARLNDRGSLVTVQEFPGPVEVSLEWRWIDIAGDITYRDALTVALHTSGKHAPAHPYRVGDGIEVAFLTTGGQVSLAPLGDAEVTGTTQPSALPMPAGKWHRIRIVDDGKTVAVYLSGPAIDVKNKDRPVLTAPYTGTFARHHIAIYNREPVAGALHESHVRSVTVGPPVAGKRE